MKAAIGVMVEGQFGLNWDRWTRVLDMAERAGYQCVFRSDHFTNPAEPDLDSLELFTSLTYAATRTKRIAFGSLVAPVTFRHPTMTVRQATAIDDLSTVVSCSVSVPDGSGASTRITVFRSTTFRPVSTN